MVQIGFIIAKQLLPQISEVFRLVLLSCRLGG